LIGCLKRLARRPLSGAANDFCYDRIEARMIRRNEIAHRRCALCHPGTGVEQLSRFLKRREVNLHDHRSQAHRGFNCR